MSTAKFQTLDPHDKENYILVGVVAEPRDTDPSAAIMLRMEDGRTFVAKIPMKEVTVDGMENTTHEGKDGDRHIIATYSLSKKDDA